MATITELPKDKGQNSKVNYSQATPSDATLLSRDNFHAVYFLDYEKMNLVQRHYVEIFYSI